MVLASAHRHTQGLTAPRLDARTTAPATRLAQTALVLLISLYTTALATKSSWLAVTTARSCTVLITALEMEFVDQTVFVFAMPTSTA